MKAGWLLAIALLISNLVCAQIQMDGQRDSSWKDRVYAGGGLGLSGGTDTYGNRYFYFALNPIVGYMFTPKFSGGLGFQWQHYDYPDIDIKYDQYGISPFMRYNIGNLFAYTEYSILNSPTYDNSQRDNFDRLLVGLGYSQPMGKRGSINVMGLYDVLYVRSERVFASPWVFRVYFSL